MGRRMDRNRAAAPAVAPDALHRIITEPGSAKLLVQQAQSLGETLAGQGLTTSQIRAIFGEVRAIQAEMQSDPAKAFRRLTLLKPKMRYRVGKETGRSQQPIATLVEVLDAAVDEVGEDEGHFTRFVEFFEAVLAYFKAAGGRD